MKTLVRELVVVVSIIFVGFVGILWSTAQSRAEYHELKTRLSNAGPPVLATIPVVLQHSSRTASRRLVATLEGGRSYSLICGTALCPLYEPTLRLQRGSLHEMRAHIVIDLRELTAKRLTPAYPREFLEVYSITLDYPQTTVYKNDKIYDPSHPR